MDGWMDRWFYIQIHPSPSPSSRPEKAAEYAPACFLSQLGDSNARNLANIIKSTMLTCEILRLGYNMC